MTLENRGGDDDGLAFGFGSFRRSGLEEEIEAIERVYDLAVLDADENDDSIVAIKGGITSCGSGSTQRAARYIS